MNCYLHPDTAAVAFCRSCGRPLCNLCQRPVDGTVFCQEHAPPVYANPAGGYAANPAANSAANPAANPATNPYVQPMPAAAGVRSSPGLAFVLGLIPGVGAIYNGQYLKGLVHAIIFGLLVSLASGAENTAGQPILVMVSIAFYLYMPFEAYHTARQRQMGLPIDEWSSLMDSKRFSSRAPVGPVILILIGVLFLLDSLHLIAFRDISRFWPVILIFIGAWMLYSRLAGTRTGEIPEPPRNIPVNDNAAEVPHER